MLDRREVQRIGESQVRKVDVRIVAATNENLPQAAEDGRFRADLLDRLSFEVITLPPLRVREGDVDVLADYFGRRMAAEIGWESWPGFADHARRQLDELGDKAPALVRGDCGYGNKDIIDVCEQRGLRYLLRLRKTANVKRLIERLFRREDWTQATEASQG